MSHQVKIEEKFENGVTIDGERPIIIVSGFPRSGTSLLMQMLEAAGLPVLTDGKRTADDSNPKGYFEMEAIKRIGSDCSCLLNAAGRVVKIVTPLLLHLPLDLNCRVLMVRRNWDELLSSQVRMRQLSDPSFKMTAQTKSMLVETFKKQEARALQNLNENSNSSVLKLKHSSLLENARLLADEVGNFLNIQIIPEAFASPVDVSLYRNRKSSGT